jgi:hypothetical protein
MFLCPGRFFETLMVGKVGLVLKDNSKTSKGCRSAIQKTTMILHSSHTMRERS